MRLRAVAVLGVLGIALLVLLVRPDRPYALDPPRDLSGPNSAHIFVVSHGWHTGLVVPAPALNARIPELAARFGTPAYYEIGWGDQGFYQAEEVTIGLALRALFWSSGAVVHIVAVPKSPQDSFPESEAKRVCLTASQVEGMEAFIAASIARDATGHVEMLGQGIYGDSQFFAGVGRYSLVNTCNKWTAKGLRSAGLDALPPLELTAGSVMRFVRKETSSAECAADVGAQGS